MASPGPTLRRHWGVRLAASLGAVLFAVTVSGVLFRIVSMEFLRAPVTGWFTWASGTIFVFFGTLIFLDRKQRANGLLLVVFGILGQLPSTGIFLGGLLPSVPVWAIFFITLNDPVSRIVLAVVLLRFPERRLQKRYERRFIAVIAIWLVSFEAIYAVTWPCWATPTKVTAWPWWLANCDLSELADLALYWGQIVAAAGLVLLLTLRILRTRGLDRRVYVPVHIASIVGIIVDMGLVVFFLVETVRGLVWSEWVLILHSLLVAQAVIPVMFFLSNVGRRLLQLRIAGMVAEINVARTPEAIQAALRRALDDTSLVIYVWSPEHKQYVDAEGRPVSGDNRPHRVTLDLTVSDGTPSARIDADESVAHHPELLRAVCDAGGLALQNSALQSSLLATIELERSSRELSETLSHLLPTGLADRLRRDGLHIGQPELVEITVLMSDIRGYSGIAETIDPAQLAVQLNAHRRAMNDVIMNRAGIVMQYMGDAVFAVFGPTTSPGKHADQAFAAAQEMHVRQDQINEAWTSQGQPAFGMGIGLSTGQVAAVLLGSDERFEYTLVGDAVNLAQRLQDLARPAGTTIMSEATWDNLTELPAQYEQLQLQLVKGRQTPVTSYRVMMPANDLRVSSKGTNTADTSEV
jgi:class 3 adenylate cyclase